MACHAFATPTITNVIGEVDFVSEKFIRLTSVKLGPGCYIQLSPTMASILLPRVDVLGELPNFETEYRNGDCMKMDIFADRDDAYHYIPLKVHSVTRNRQDGFRMNAVGMIVNTTEYAGVVIRSCEIPGDVTCKPADLVVPPDCFANVGSIVSFEVVDAADPLGLFQQSNFQCVAARVYSPTVSDVGFSYYRNAQGRIVNDEANNTHAVQFHFDEKLPERFLPANSELPIFEGAYYGGCAPVKNLDNEYVSCFICAKNPHLHPDSDFEVIKIDGPQREFAVTDTECMPSSTFESTHTPIRGQRLSVVETQCSTFYNREVAKTMQEAFCFFVEHAQPQQFQRMLDKCPHFVSVMLKETGLDQALNGANSNS